MMIYRFRISHRRLLPVRLPMQMQTQINRSGRRMVFSADSRRPEGTLRLSLTLSLESGLLQMQGTKMVEGRRGG